MIRSLHSAPASPSLRPFVRAFAQRTGVGISASQPMPSYLETVIQFDFGDPPVVRTDGSGWKTTRVRSVVGPHISGETALRFDGVVDSFAIFLQPTGLWLLFHIPVSAVMGTDFDADDVLGSSAANLWDALAEQSDFTARVRTAELYLGNYISEQLPGTPMSAAAALLARRGGSIAIHDLAAELQLSERQLERAFLRDIGIQPKRFARVARFQAALDARVTGPDRAWVDIATAGGYHDQMHLVHEFKSFAGMSPNVTLRRLGDSRPEALAHSTKSAHT